MDAKKGWQGASRLRLIAAVLGSLVLFPPAAAAADAPKAPRLSERQLRAFETRVLGPEHAREHAEARAEIRRARRCVTLRRAGGETRCSTDPHAGGTRPANSTRSASVPVAAGPPSSVGQWSAPVNIPVPAIHAALLATGKVLWISYPDGNKSNGTAWLWDPKTRATKRVDPPLWRDPSTGQLRPASLWCSGHAFLADGRLLVSGGNVGNPSDPGGARGLNKLYTFNPWNETWTEQPDMVHGRWYPTVSTLPDGRALIISGLQESGAKLNTDVDLFTPSPNPNGVGTLTHLGSTGGPGGPPLTSLYPHMFSMVSGWTMSAGPRAGDTFFLRPTANSTSYEWRGARPPSRTRVYSSGTLLPDAAHGASRIMLAGGSPNDQGTAVSSTEIYNEGTGSWTAGPSQAVARSHQNTVILPDGSLLAVGGGYGYKDGSIYAADAQHKVAERLDPVTNNWIPQAAETELRSYHSTALLLPDGRVVSAGDDSHGGNSTDTAEIFSPPYLLNGTARPQISTAPSSISYNTSFTVGTPSTNVSKVVLMAPSAVTHANDMSQRYVSLGFVKGAGAVYPAAPANARVAPPGWYMLFLVSSNGTPSVARFVRLG